MSYGHPSQEVATPSYGHPSQEGPTPPYGHPSQEGMNAPAIPSWEGVGGGKRSPDTKRPTPVGMREWCEKALSKHKA